MVITIPKDFDWAHFRKWLELDYESPEWHKNYQGMIAQLIEFAKGREAGKQTTLHMLDDPRRMRQRFLKQMFENYAKFKVFEEVQKEHEAECCDPFVCIDFERGCLMVVKEEAERRYASRK